MEYCKCYIKTNTKCAKCDKPYEIATTKQQQIDDLRKKIHSNIIDNTCYKMEIRELEEINKIDICDENTLIERCSNNSDDEYTTKSEDNSDSSDSE